MLRSVYTRQGGEIEEGTRADPLLWKVRKYIQKGWPADSSHGLELARFFNRRDDLSTVGDCVLFRERVVIPKELRMRCLNHLHRGHPGIQRMKSIARSYLYWPSIDEDIADCVSTCSSCMEVVKSPPLLELKPWPKTSTPWERVHIDYAAPVDGVYFLILVDAFSKWPEVVKTSTITTTATISILRSIFARFGMPAKLVSGNGAQFTSDTFNDFCIQSGIEHVKTPPFHPQSNGQAERFVDTLKRALKKIQSKDTSTEAALDIFLQSYRSTPHPALDQRTPAEAMFGRNIRIALDLIRPTPHTEVDQRKNQQPFADRQFQPGDAVYAKTYSRNVWKWVTGVVSKRIGSVMYEVITDGHRTHRRHVNQLRKRTPGCRRSLTSESAKHQLPLDMLTEMAPTPKAPVERNKDPSSTPRHLSSNGSPTQQTVQPLPSTFGTSNRQPIQPLRRSSRLRRPPRRLDGYRLY
ncbi:uncharacterized protein K02A2.6-like [Anopheles stephensi]|uniref:uncharacterized protein K02A2.6-like n=1 Tax=Anopheles stephensi TaxID=30069 RepID=UPI0016587497|nr:uncharacterized protein K02A2.6-like [Anopheles stephensi]